MTHQCRSHQPARRRDVPRDLNVIAGRIDPTRRQQWLLKFDIAKPAIVAALGSAGADAAIQQFMEYLDRKDALTFSTQFTVTGRRRS